MTPQPIDGGYFYLPQVNNSPDVSMSMITDFEGSRFDARIKIVKVFIMVADLAITRRNRK